MSNEEKNIGKNEENDEAIKEKKKIKFTDKKIWIPVVSVVAVLVLFFAFALFCMMGDGIRGGVSIGEVSVGGMSTEEAITAVNAYIEAELADNKLDIEYEGETTQYNFTDLITGYNVEKAVSEASETGRNGNFLMNALNSVKAKLFGTTINLQPDFDDNFMVEFAEKYAKSVADGLEENTYTVENDKIVFVNGKAGYSINTDEAIEKIKKAVTSKNNEKIVLEKVMCDPKPFDAEKLYTEVCTPPVDASYQQIDGKGYLIEPKNGYNFDKSAMKAFLEANKTNTEKYEFALEVVPPQITKADTDGLFTETLASYTSKITDQNVDRLANVKLAAQKINGVILNPGDIFAYLSHVEPITRAAGYKVANVYANGTVTQDVGGGVCQVSSALYSAVLYADLEVTKRYAHSLTVAYVPMGMDATVASGEIDFRFKNNTNEPIKIVTNFTNAGITATILGKKPDPTLKIEVENVTVQTLHPQEEITEDASLPLGKREVDYGGKNGYVVQTYKKYIRNGVVEKTEHVGRSTYKARNKTVRVGTGPAEEADAPASAEITQPEENGGANDETPATSETTANVQTQSGESDNTISENQSSPSEEPAADENAPDLE